MRAMWSRKRPQNDCTDADSDVTTVDSSTSSPSSHPTTTCKRQRKRQDSSSTSSSKATTCSMLGCILESVIAANTETTEVSCSTVPSLLHSFTSTCTPGISIGDYMTRLASLVDNDSTLVLAAYHIRTVLHQHSARNLRLSATNVHRLALAALLCAVKMHEDKLYRNALYAKIGGISNPEINKLEIEFLALIEFNLYVPVGDYEAFFEEVSDARLHRNCKCAYGASLLSMSPLQIGRAVTPLSPPQLTRHTRPNSPDYASDASTPSHQCSTQSSPFTRPSSSMSNYSHTSTAPSVCSSAWSSSAPTTPFVGSPNHGTATPRPSAMTSGATLSRPASAMSCQSPLSRPASAMGFQSPIPSLHAYNPSASSALLESANITTTSALATAVHYPLSPPSDSPASHSEPGLLVGHHHGITILV